MSQRNQHFRCHRFFKVCCRSCSVSFFFDSLKSQGWGDIGMEAKSPPLTRFWQKREADELCSSFMEVRSGPGLNTMASGALRARQGTQKVRNHCDTKTPSTVTQQEREEGPNVCFFNHQQRDAGETPLPFPVLCKHSPKLFVRPLASMCFSGC